LEQHLNGASIKTNPLQSSLLTILSNHVSNGGSSFNRNKIENTKDIYVYTGFLSCIIENHTINIGLKTTRETKPKNQKHKFKNNKKGNNNVTSIHSAIKSLNVVNIDAILKAADEIQDEDSDVVHIFFEHLYSLAQNLEWIAVWSLERVASDISTDNTSFIERGSMLTTKYNLLVNVTHPSAMKLINDSSPILFKS